MHIYIYMYIEHIDEHVHVHIHCIYIYIYIIVCECDFSVKNSQCMVNAVEKLHVLEKTATINNITLQSDSLLETSSKHYFGGVIDLSRNELFMRILANLREFTRNYSK